MLTARFNGSPGCVAAVDRGNKEKEPPGVTPATPTILTNPPGARRVRFYASTFARRTLLRLEHDLDAAVLLLLEFLVHFGGVVERRGVGFQVENA